MSNTIDSAWARHLARAEQDAPLIAPLFVLERGPTVRILDLRPATDAQGVLGYIPGSTFVREDDLREAVTDCGDTPIVLVDADGRRAAVLARVLELAGIPNVAAMEGGLTAWRRDGLGVSRDPAGVSTRLEPAQAEPPPVTGHLTIDQVRQHIGGPGVVRWLQLGSLMFAAHASCVDGRDGRAVVGMPGGDAGELMLSLAAVEHVTGRALSEDDVYATLLAHVDKFSDFYLHSDSGAIEALAEDLSGDQRTAAAVADIQDKAGWLDFLNAPPAELQGALLEHLTNPANIGCGHLRLALQHPDEYEVRAELVAALIRSFHRLNWNGSTEVQPTVLGGGHAESAVVNVRLADPLWLLSDIPVVSPSFAGSQIFVNHADVSAFLRKARLGFFTKDPSPASVAPEQADAFLSYAQALADRQLGTTLKYLAKGLPIYDVIFARDGSFEVRGA